MFYNTKFQAVVILLTGGLLGYIAATGGMRVDRPANAANANTPTTDTSKPELLLAQASKAADQKSSGNGKKPNILFIMGDDIGWMQPGCYHRGLMVGETPNIDRIANEGGMFMHYYAESSCTAGRCAFVTGMTPYRVGMLLPQLPGAISYLRPERRASAKFLLDLGYTHRRVRQEPPWRSSRFAADRARLPGVLGLPLPPGRNAAGELPGHQQEPRPSRPSCRR